MKKKNSYIDKEVFEAARPYIWFGLIGAFLTVINTTVATLAFGVWQGLIISFTTPFAFIFAKLRYPRLPGATAIYIPLIIVAFFTFNFGIPGYYKVLFLLGPIFYDFTCVILRVGREKIQKVPLWKLILAIIFYPPGLLIGAKVAIRIWSVELPLAESAKIAGGFMLLFWIMGSFATWFAHRIYYKYIKRELLG